MDDFKKCKKIGILDIECSALDAQYGYMISACIKQVNEKNLKGPTFSVRIDDKRNPDPKSDKWVVQELIKKMNTYDLIITWYGSQYDIPFINTRALKHRIAPPHKNFRRDLCFVARGVGKLKNNRLATWGSFLFGKSGKTFLDFSVWLSAIRGDKKAIDYIVEHCEKDVLETEKIYKVFGPLLGKLRKR